jgi:WD40 repeat protein
MTSKNTINVRRMVPSARHSFLESVVRGVWSPLTSRVAVLTYNGQLHLLDGESLTLSKSVMAHDGGGLDLKWSPDGMRIATSGQDGSVRIWDANDLSLVRSLPCGAQWVEHVAWQDSYTLSAAMGRKVFLGTVKSGEWFEVYSASGAITGLAWRPNGELVLTTNGQCLRLAVGDRIPAQVVGGFNYPVAMLKLALSPHGTYAAIGCQDSSARVWLVDEDENGLAMRGYDEKVQVVAWDSGEQHLAVSGGALVAVWSFKNQSPEGTMPRELLGHSHLVVDAAFSPCGRYVSSVDKGGILCLWDLTNDGFSPVAAALSPGSFQVLGWSRDGSRIFTGDLDGVFALWSMEDIGPPT